MTEKELDLIERRASLYEVLDGMGVEDAKAMLSDILERIGNSKICCESDVMTIRV